MTRARKHLDSGRIPVIAIIIALISSLTLGVVAVRGVADAAKDKAIAAERTSRDNLLSSVEFTEAVERRIQAELSRRSAERDRETCLLLDAVLTQPQPKPLRWRLLAERSSLDCFGVAPSSASIEQTEAARPGPTAAPPGPRTTNEPGVGPRATARPAPAPIPAPPRRPVTPDPETAPLPQPVGPPVPLVPPAQPAPPAPPARPAPPLPPPLPFPLPSLGLPPLPSVLP